MQPKIYWISGAVIVAVAAAFFLRGGVAPAVDVVSPTRGQAVQAVYATGTVEPTVMVPVAARNTARLIELNADEGHEVKKGQVLAQLEDDDLQASLQELQAKEALAKEEFQRATALLSKGSGTKQASDRARAEWDAARAALERASAQLDFMKLLAPEGGTIIRRDGEVGQLIPANQPVFWMACCAPLRITAEVDEEDIPLVKPGQEVLVRADAFPDKTFNGTVLSITPKGDPVARSYRVRIGLPQDTELMIGMTAETNIMIEKKPDALLLPAGAVQGGRVWRVEGGSLEVRPVKLGIRNLEKVEVLEGVGEGDQVVLAPDGTLEPGTRVRARKVVSPTPASAEK